MSIYQRIKEISYQKKLSIREIEHQLAFSNGTISKWTSKAPSDKLLQVANYLNVSIDQLMGNTSKKVVAELTSNDFEFTYEGETISNEDMEIIRRVLRGK